MKTTPAVSGMSQKLLKQTLFVLFYIAGGVIGAHCAENQPPEQPHEAVPTVIKPAEIRSVEKQISTGESEKSALVPFLKGPGPFTILSKTNLVYVIPVREEVDEPLVYLIRRGVKEAASKKADLIILDMKTPGGRVDYMMEIMEIMERSSVKTMTFVNNEAFSAGALIAVSTQHIMMSPNSVIGAAAPITMGQQGVMELPHKFVSAIAAKVRLATQKNGYHPLVVEKMIDKELELPFSIAGRKLDKGMILTLTNSEAEFAVAYKEGEELRPIISSGTAKDRAELLEAIGLKGATVVDVQRTGAETLGVWINKISFILLTMGILFAWFEIKTQGFGLLGFAALMCFGLFFFGQYIAALSGLENLLVIVIVFMLGAVLIVVDVILLSGTIVVGLIGLTMMVAALLMGMVDWYPGAPPIPRWEDLEQPLTTMGLSVAAAVVLAMILGRFLPSTPLFKKMVLNAASDGTAVSPTGATGQSLVGALGIAASSLRPSGKGMFGDRLVDVVTQGEMIERDAKIRVVAVEGARVVVMAA